MIKLIRDAGMIVSIMLCALFAGSHFCWADYAAPYIGEEPQSPGVYSPDSQAVNEGVVACMNNYETYQQPQQPAAPAVQNGVDTDVDSAPYEEINNVHDTDTDGDGIPNQNDNDIDGDGVTNDEDDDIDGDGDLNGADNDIDGDGVTNDEDDDIDGDGVPNNQDDDVDGDGYPNNDDDDVDGDGIEDDCDDNVPDTSSSGTSYQNTIDCYLNCGWIPMGPITQTQTLSTFEYYKKNFYGKIIK